MVWIMPCSSCSFGWRESRYGLSNRGRREYPSGSQGKRAHCGARSGGELGPCHEGRRHSRARCQSGDNSQHAGALCLAGKPHYARCQSQHRTQQGQRRGDGSVRQLSGDGGAVLAGKFPAHGHSLKTLFHVKVCVIFHVAEVLAQALGNADKPRIGLCAL